MGNIDQELEQTIRALLEQCRETAAIDAAVRGYGPIVLKRILFYLRDQDAASDVFAEFCETLCKDIQSFRWESSFLTWAQRVADHAVSHFAQRLERRRERELLTDDASDLDRGFSSVDGRGVKRQRTATHPYKRTALTRRMGELKQWLAPADRDLLEQHLVRGLSWQEIAADSARGDGRELDAAAIERQAVVLRKRFSRLLLRMKQILDEDGRQRFDRIVERLDDLDRSLIDLALRQDRSWPEIIDHLRARWPSLKLETLRSRVRQLEPFVAQLCEAEGLLPAESRAAGVGVEEPDRSGPALSGRSRERRGPRR